MNGTGHTVGEKLRVAVIGSGMAGAACARFLVDAGHDVRLFEKSRGVGGRLATRRARWVAPDGAEHGACFDHGAPGFSARSPAFIRFVEQACHDGLLSCWAPRAQPGGYGPLDNPAPWVPSPDMPSLCRALLAGVPVLTDCTVDALQASPAGWRLCRAGSTVGEGFDAVVVAIPPPQAAALLQPHQTEWARRAEAVPMLPGWVLMGVTDDPLPPPAWDVAWPMSGPLAWVVRNDAKPARERVPGRAYWVVHAQAGWSQTHLESPALDVQAALQHALAACLDRELNWHHCAVHRWRYASAMQPSGPASGATERCWWDAPLGLGVCNDALGGAGVEGAWLSARALAAHLIDHRPGSQAQSRVVSSSLAHL